MKLSVEKLTEGRWDALQRAQERAKERCNELESNERED